MLDVSDDPAWTGPCPDGVSVFVATADDVGWMVVPRGTTAAIAVLDRGKDDTLTVWIEAKRSAFDAFKTAALPIVMSIEFEA
jgi:hypothetical protein